MHDVRGAYAMSDFMDLLTSGIEVNRNTCRMAYTLGRAQPVLCTLLGNDPFFFDVDPEALEHHLDDSAALDDADFPIPEALRIARSTSEGFVTLGDDIDGLPLTDDLADLCRNALCARSALDVGAALDLLSLSSTGSVLRGYCDAMNVTVRGDACVHGVQFDAAHSLIRVNTTLDVHTATLMIAREMRRAQLMSVNTALQNPDSAILIHRALQAELLILPVQIAWELSLAGSKEAWETLSRGPLADLAYAFGHRATNDFRALRDGRAQMAAFDQWFYSGRTRKADRALIQCLLSMGERLADNFRAQTHSTIETLRTIGERGIGRNYLLDHMMNLTSDGFYGDVRDRSNANFLWFVKFERSYRAAETHLEEQKKTEEVAAPMAGSGAVILAFPDLFAKRGKKTRRTAHK